MLTAVDYAAQYEALGWKLCAITPGTKAPKYKDWGKHPISPEAIGLRGIGLIHVLSRTCAIDIDNLHEAAAWLANHNVDLNDLLIDDDAVLIDSGRPNRSKLLYRLPDSVEPLPTRKVKNPNGQMVIEFRCAPSIPGSDAMQDVLPPTIHPETGKPYQWGGNGSFTDLPTLPESLLNVWLGLEDKAQKPSTGTAQTISDGGRNDTLFKKGGDLAALGLNEIEIEAALQAMNTARCNPPLLPAEVSAIAKSAAKNSQGAKTAQSVYPLHRRDHMVGKPPVSYAMQSIFPRKGVGAIVATKASGKSFMALDMGAHMALGMDWFGYGVSRPVNVVYVVLEGGSGFGQRVRAWEQNHGVSLPDNFYFLDGEEVNLFGTIEKGAVRKSPDIQKLINTLKVLEEPFVFIDTLAKSIDGANENDNNHMSIIAKNAERIAEAVDGFICFVSHPFKTAGDWKTEQGVYEIEVRGVMLSVVG